MRRLLITFTGTLLFFGGALPLVAQEPFAVTAFQHRQEGLDRLFTFTIENHEVERVLLHGRFIVLNVYDTSPPISLPIESLGLEAGETTTATVRWSNAPLMGQVRSLLVLNSGPGKTTVDDFEFWIFPWQAFLILLGAIMVLAGTFLGIMKVLSGKKETLPEGPGPEKASALPDEKKKDETDKKKKSERSPPPKKRRRYPSGMTGYVVEFGDTVVTVANRFGVTWEDIVRANRLKPPYPLKTGGEILIPLHELRTPGKEEASG